MNRRRLFVAAALAGAVAFSVTPRADVGRADTPVYAITGARLVTAAGPPIASGTLVIRNGLIEAVGAEVRAPADAIVVDGEGLQVYPGLIDMGNGAGLDAQPPAAPGQFRTLEDAERFKRTVILRPELVAADVVRADAPELARLAAAGVTSVLATPTTGLFKGQSALVNVTAPEDEPQIGAVADQRRGLQVVRTPVAQHVSLALPGGRGGGGYPVSLLGSIAFVRQAFLDARHYQLEQAQYGKAATGAPRPTYDPSLAALQPALGRALPVIFDAELAREILRALNMAREFNLDPVIAGGREADQVAADLKAQNARVIYSLNYPTRSRLLAPDADEPLRELRARADAPKTPAALDRAGILFAFASDGLAQPQEFLRNAGRAVREGLPADAAVRALTINAARIAGADAQVGSLERGKIANVIVTSGDLFAPGTRVVHIFVDGRKVVPEPAAPGGGRGRGRGAAVDLDERR
jgi:imidazolonepropionase-like amidohydrolase